MERFVNEVRQFSQMRPKSYTCPMCGKIHRFPTEMDYFYSQKDRYGNLELWKGYHWFETRCDKTGGKVKWLFCFHNEEVAIKCKINGIDLETHGRSTTKENELFMYLTNNWHDDPNLIHNEMFVKHPYKSQRIRLLIPLMVRFEPIQVEKSKLYWNRTGNQPNVDFTNIEDMLAVAKRQDVTDDILRQVVSKVLELRAKEGNSATETEEILLMIIENPNVSEETANIIINSTQLTDLEFVILKGEKVSEKILKKLLIEGKDESVCIYHSNLDKIFRNPRASDEVCLQCLEVIKKEYVSNAKEKGKMVQAIYPYLAGRMAHTRSSYSAPINWLPWFERWSPFEIRAHLILPLVMKERIQSIKDANDRYEYRYQDDIYDRESKVWYGRSEWYAFKAFLVRYGKDIKQLVSSPAISSEGLIEFIDNMDEIASIIRDMRKSSNWTINCFVDGFWSNENVLKPMEYSLFSSILINKNCTSKVLLKMAKHRTDEGMMHSEKLSLIKMIAEHPNANRRVIRELAKQAIKLIDAINNAGGVIYDESYYESARAPKLISDILIFLRDPRILEKDLQKILEEISKDELSQMLTQGLLEEDTEEE